MEGSSEPPRDTSHVLLTTIIGTVIGGLILGAVVEILVDSESLLTIFVGEIWVTPIKLLLAALFVIYAIVALYYYFVDLDGGGKEPGSDERQRYDKLRNNLRKGGRVKRIYVQNLEKWLRKADSFLGDSCQPMDNAASRVFGLEKPAHLWTTQSLDRCILWGQAYPLIAVFISWAITGEVGPVESSLLLDKSDWWRRCFAFLCSAMAFFFLLQCSRRTSFRDNFWWLAAAATAVAVVLAVGGAIEGIGTAAFAVAFAIFYGVAIFAAFARSLLFNEKSTLKHKGLILWLFVFLMIVLWAVVMPWTWASSDFWRIAGPLSLFLGLLTFIHAPMDWLSLGLTRALLRRGVKSNWPFAYALIDAGCAVLLLVVLACALVVGVQTFAMFEKLGGAENPDELLLNTLALLRSDPLNAQVYWVYITLFSIMIPSILNLVISGLALGRGIPRLTFYMYSLMPHGKAMPEFHRICVALFIAAQMVLGTLLTITAQPLLLIVIIGYLLPGLIGHGILDIASGLANFDFPGWAARIFSVHL